MDSKELVDKLRKSGEDVPSFHSTFDEEKARQILFKEKSESPHSPKLEKKESKDKEKKSLEKLKIPEGIVVKDYAQLVGKPPNEIIKRLIELGELLTINQSMSPEAITILSESLGYEAEIVSPFQERILEEEESEVAPRPPVVTIMGHVDHGKTTLLDAIRKTDVALKEFGGITQHIGAYQVEHHGKRITFIDTPGHEAFTAMRARGAKITDIAVLVVAADDGVMPQTIEAIDHARAAQVPIIVAINKIDKPDANPEKVKQQLTEHGLVPEEWGGDTVFVSISAKERTNLEELLEMILLVAEFQELKAPYKTRPRGVVIESKLDKGRGPVVTVLVERGVLKVGTPIVVGLTYGKIRAMIDDKGANVEKAFPAQPVELLGLSAVPEAGSEFFAVSDEKEARKIAEERALKKRLIQEIRRKHFTLEQLYQKVEEGELSELKLIIKGDTHGSIEAIKDALTKLDQTKVKINIIHTGVGGISETDVMLGAASDAVVIGFNVRPDQNAKVLAKKENIDLRTYRVIYQLIEDIQVAMKGLLAPEFEEVELGHLEVRATFKVSKIGQVAGCYVSSGKVANDAQARVIRDGNIIFEGKIASLRRFKEDVREVKAGLECGLRIENFQDFKEGDEIEIFKVVEKKVT